MLDPQQLLTESTCLLGRCIKQEEQTHPIFTKQRVCGTIERASRRIRRSEKLEEWEQQERRIRNNERFHVVSYARTVFRKAIFYGGVFVSRMHHIEFRFIQSIVKLLNKSNSSQCRLPTTTQLSLLFLQQPAPFLRARICSLERARSALQASAAISCLFFSTATMHRFRRGRFLLWCRAQPASNAAAVIL